MDWFPLYNSLRIALIASVIVFFTGIFAAYYIAKLHPVVKGVLDVVLTLFSADGDGTQKTAGRLAFVKFWNQAGNDLVFRYFRGGCGGLSADVPDSPGGL